MRTSSATPPGRTTQNFSLLPGSLIPASLTPGRSARAATLSIMLALTASGCKTTSAPVDDATLTSNIQKAISSDTVVSAQPVLVSVQNGVATLTGTAANDAQKTVAARDAAAVAGVAKVVNNIAVGPPATAQVAAPLPLPVAPVSTPASTELVQPARAATPVPAIISRRPAPIERRDSRRDSSQREPQQASGDSPAQPAQQPYRTPEPVAAAPAPPPPPAFRTVTVAAGSTIPVRVTQTLDSASTQPDSTFSGVLASDIVVDGLVAIPAGSAVSGHVDAVQEAAHFKGSALLTVSLISISRRGERLSVATDPYSVKGKGRGVNTAEKAGGGAAVGAILGGIFGGGKGAAIGAAAGGGVGAGSQAITRGQQVQIESESVVRFHLTSPITVKVRSDGGTERRGDDGGLQPR